MYWKRAEADGLGVLKRSAKKYEPRKRAVWNSNTS